MTVSTKKQIIIIYSGLQNSGKSSQRKKAKEKWELPDLSTGDEIRELIRKGDFSENSTTQKGGLNSDDLIFDIIKKHPASQKPIFILDGAPRDEEQAAMLQEEFPQEKFSQVEFYLVELVISEKEFQERLVGRLEEENRIDDRDMEAVTRRKRIYQEETKPVIDKFPFKKRLSVCGDGKTKEQVFAEIEPFIESILKEVA